MENKPSFFRVEALNNYWQAQEKITSPKLAAPCSLPLLWSGLVALFILAGLVAWANRVPVYTTGYGLMLSDSTASAYLPEQAVVLVFVPTEQLPNLQPGQSVELQSQLQSLHWQATLEKIEPEGLTVEEIIRRYGLEKNLANLITRPSAAVLASLKCATVQKDLDCHSLSAAYSGRVFSAKVEVGSRRLLSLLPLMTQLTGD